jgi:translocation and assembly module TamB
VLDGVIYIPEGGRNPIALDVSDPAVISVVRDTTTAKQEELVGATSPLMKNLRAAINLRVNRDTWVRNDEANIEIYSEGDLNIDVDQRVGALTLNGTMATERGQYTFLSRRFLIERGTATFIGSPDINPLVQATAQYEVQPPSGDRFNIVLLIGGTARAPTLTLQSTAQPPLSQSDLLAYLAFSRPSSSLLAAGNSAGVSGATPAAGGFVGAAGALVRNQLAGVALGVAVNGLEDNLARSLGADVLNITPAELPTGLTDVEGFLLTSQVEYGRYLTTDSYLGLTFRPQVLNFFSTDAQGRQSFTQAPPGIVYQYRLPRGLQLQTVFEPRYQLQQPTLAVQEATAWPVFGFFLTREWRF